MSNKDKFIQKLTKAFVATVVLSSVSFGAYGFGKAVRQTEAEPNSGYYAVWDTWRDIPYFYDRLGAGTGYDWENLQRMVSLRLPQGDYMVTTGGYLYNGDTMTHRVNCWLKASEGASTSVFLAGDEVLNVPHHSQMAMSVGVTVTAESARISLKCGIYDQPTSPENVQVQRAYISAVSVQNLRSFDKSM